MQQPRETILTLESIDRFRSWLSARTSPKTVGAYATDLKTFLTDTGETGLDLDEFEEMAMSWLQMKRQEVAPKTTQRRITSLRKFAQYVRLPGKILDDFIAPIPAKSVPHPIAEGMDGVLRLIKVCSKPQHEALVVLCGMVGLRVSEALAVRPSDFSLQGEKRLSVRGKGDKTRIVPVTDQAWDILLMPVGEALVAGNETVVGLKDRFARQLIKNLGERAGLKYEIASHDLRATLATHVYNKTKNFRLVQEILGHASVNTTQIYIGIEFEKMREGMEL